MDKQQLATLQRSSALAWVALNKFQNENQKELEFVNHRFMIDIYADNAPDIVCIKSAQVGFSVFSILKSFHELKYEKRNILYALPTRNVVQDFVVPKVNPLIASNPKIAADMGSDSVSLKKLGDRFIYFKGGSEREAISVSADTLVIDEFDRMPDMNVVTMFDSRLQAAIEPRRRRFSNPSTIGFGIDALWKTSNMRHWFITCHACNHEWYIDLDPSDEHNHYIDRTQAEYVCGRCSAVLTNADRRNGRWVAKYAQRSRHGYWISQLIAPWVSAARILEQEDEMDIQTFHGFVLGKAYTQADLRFDRDAINNACRPAVPVLQHVVMGSDIGKPHWYWLATPNGFFKYGHTADWNELERIFLEYNCEAWVMDAMPEFTQVQAMLKKYPHRAYACYFIPDNKAVGAIRWQEGDKRGLVYADRTKAIDRFVTEMTTGQNRFMLRAQDMDEMIRHAANMYRVIETAENGKTLVEWRTITKPDHLMFAAVYARIALEKVFSGVGAGVVTTTSSLPNIKTGPTIQNGKATFTVDVKGSLAKSQTIR